MPYSAQTASRCAALAGPPSQRLVVQRLVHRHRQRGRIARRHQHAAPVAQARPAPRPPRWPPPAPPRPAPRSPPPACPRSSRSAPAGPGRRRSARGRAASRAASPPPTGRAARSRPGPVLALAAADQHRVHLRADAADRRAARRGSVSVVLDRHHAARPRRSARSSGPRSSSRRSAPAQRVGGCGRAAGPAPGARRRSALASRCRSAG